MSTNTEKLTSDSEVSLSKLLGNRSYTVKEAAEHALEFCKNNKGWKRICDIEDSDSLYKKFNELDKKERMKWIGAYRSNAEEAYNEFGRRPCKVLFGFISGAGTFYNEITDIPLYHNSMMIFKVA